MKRALLIALFIAGSATQPSYAAQDDQQKSFSREDVQCDPAIAATGKSDNRGIVLEQSIVDRQESGRRQTEAAIARMKAAWEAQHAVQP